MLSTVQLPDDLLKATENFAAATHRDANEIVEQALRDWLAQHQITSPVRLITYGRDGLLPGVNLDDSAALLAIMDAADDPA